MSNKISILGTGAVGQALAVGFLKYGYEVAFGTREPDKKIEWKNADLAQKQVLSFREAAKSGEIVILAIKGAAAEEVVKEVAGELHNKVVIDVTNPIAELPPENGVLRYFTTLEESLMERLQKIAPKARFVKAFNSVGNAYMVNPDFGGIKPTMFICGNDEKAKQEVSGILDKFGFIPEDMGSVTSARAIEPLCILWCIPGFIRNDWQPRAFKLLK